MFYTSLYRCFLNPVNATSHDNLYLDSQGEINKADNFVYYSSWSLWDTYRTRFPLLSLIDPFAYSDICKSLVALYQSGKPEWSSNFESSPSVRTEHSILVLLDAFKKGIEGISLEKIYEKMEEEAEGLPMRSPDNHLETAYDLWGMGHIAKELGKDSDAERYFQKASQIWKNVWKKKFKDIKEETFDVMHGEGLYEGTLWQYRWSVPYDINGLALMVGGTENLVAQLKYFFENELYNQGNEPDIHAPFIFGRLNRPDLTNKWVASILKDSMNHRYGTHDHFKNPYTGMAYKAAPRAFIPEMDDDDGTMSAWFVWASIGLYPLVVGEPYYDAFKPLFDEVIINPGNGTLFRIVNNSITGRSRMFLNDKKVDGVRLSHDDIINGGLLIFK